MRDRFRHCRVEGTFGVVDLAQELFGHEVGLAWVDPNAVNTINGTSGTSPPCRSSSKSLTVTDWNRCVPHARCGAVDRERSREGPGRDSHVQRGDPQAPGRQEL